MSTSLSRLMATLMDENLPVTSAHTAGYRPAACCSMISASALSK
eukprot:CAMPEP_0173300454 /NCGR_PEP_ID=MMETSP1143-20121109/17234_1 /TAXON_ID=483371 /ORGANISM="non described non described, Strain CCMP2298" /LENGTH=43 /DNA_ID= /DNA_START= /DNA_END= /DNA_ORIENTATION=